MLWTTPQDCRTKNKVVRLPQRIFDMFIFFAICLRFLRDIRQPQDTQGCRKTAARHTRCSYDWRYVVRQPHICLTSVARLLKGNRALYRKAVARMPRNARQQCGTRTTYRFVLRQSCYFWITVLGQPFIWREIIVRTSYDCLTLDVILCEIVCDLPQGLYALSPTTKTHD